MLEIRNQENNLLNNLELWNYIYAFLHHFLPCLAPVPLINRAIKENGRWVGVFVKIFANYFTLWDFPHFVVPSLWVYVAAQATARDSRVGAITDFPSFSEDSCGDPATAKIWTFPLLYSSATVSSFCFENDTSALSVLQYIGKRACMNRMGDSAKRPNKQEDRGHGDCLNISMRNRQEWGKDWRRGGCQYLLDEEGRVQICTGGKMETAM